MSNEPKKKGLARLFARLAGGYDLSQAEERQKALLAAAEAYEGERRAGRDFDMARRPLDEMAATFVEADLDTLEVYEYALQRNKGDLDLLHLVVSRYEENQASPASRAAIEAYWALTVAEPHILSHYFPLINHYRTNDDPLTLLKLEQQIVERMWKIQRGELADGAHRESNLYIYGLAIDDLSRVYMEMNRTDADAVAIYVERFKLDSNDNETLAMLARCFREKGRTDLEALDIYEKYFVLAPEDPGLQKILVESYLEQGMPERAIVLMETLFQSVSDDFGLLSRIVHYYRSRHLLTEASITRFKEYARLRPEDDELPRLIAEYHALRQDISAEAVHYYRRVIRSSAHAGGSGELPGGGIYHQLIARHYVQREQWHEALDALAPMGEAHKVRGDALLTSAVSRARLGMTDPGSTLFYEKAVAFGARSRLLYNTLSLCYIQQRRFDSATLQHFEGTITIDPQSPWGYFGIAAYYFRLDEPQNAYLFATKHVNFNPDDPGGRKLAGYCLARVLTTDALENIMHLADEAVVDILLAAFTEAGNDARILLPLAKRLLRLPGRDADALPVFEALRQMYPADVVILETLRDIYLRQNNAEAAQEAEFQLALLALAPEPTTQFGRSLQKIRNTLVEAITHQVERILPRKTISRDEEDVLRLAVREDVAGSQVYRKLALLSADRNEIGAEVIPFYERALADNPELLALRHLLMQSYIAVGRFREVLNQATDMLLESPYNSMVLNLVIQCLMHEGAYDPDLHELIRTHYQHRLTDARTTVAYALFNYRSGRHDREAMIVYERALEHADADQAMMLRAALARCYEEANDPQRASEVYQAILSEIPDDLQILKRLTFNNIRAGETHSKADEIIRAALEDGPYDLELYLKLLEFHINRRKPALAQFLVDRILINTPNAIPRLIPLLEKAMRMGLAGPAMSVQLAEYYFLDGNKAKALRQLNQLPPLTPRQAEGVIELYNIMLAQDGDDLEIRRRRGEMLAMSGATMQAVEDLSLYWEEQGRLRPLPDSFIQLVERFLAESTQIHPKLLVLLARSFYRAGRYNDCVRITRRILKRVRNHPEALLYLGIALYQRKEWDQALLVLKRLQPTREVQEWLYRLACDYQRVGHLEEAREVLNLIMIASADFRDCAQRDDLLRRRLSRNEDSVRRRDARMITRLGQTGQGRYELVEEVGRSPLATVYKAWDKDLDDIVTLKFLSPHLAANPRAAGLFLEEARRQQKLQHPNILRIREIHTAGQTIYLNVEYMDRFGPGVAPGQPQYPHQLKLTFLQQAADALSYAHQHDFIHGNLRPENLLLNSINILKLSDFGLHRLYNNPNIFSERMVVRRPYYTAPELLLGEPVSRASDVYSFGAVAYAVFSGKPPFSTGDLERRHLHEPPAPLANSPRVLSDIILRCLAKNPRDRPTDWREIMAALQELRLAHKQMMLAGS